MNQLEHLKALRDKARIQTEQAKAVLKQQGEISESLDRLIEALEGSGDLSVASNAALSAADTGHVGSKTVPVPSQIPSDVVWETESLPEVQPITSPKKADKPEPPRLEPIVWEVAADDAASVISEHPTEGDDSDGPSSRFKFLKLGDGVEGADQPLEEEKRGLSPAVGVAAAGGVAAIAAGAASLLKGKGDDVVEQVQESIPVPAPITPPSVPAPETTITPPDFDLEDTEDTIAIPAAAVAAIKPPITPPVQTFEPSKINSNIFFDANSAYLKDSELTKLKVITDSIDGDRVIKIQGLEDLASSNDFKELLASRRMLAVKKKLAEGGVKEEQITLTEINLSEEGRILSPPSLSVEV